MGYYTDFTLSLSDREEEIFKRIDEEYYTHFLEGSGQSWEIKWYEHEGDFKKVSKEFPHILFTLDGEGEESGDVWRKYFMGGKMQDANTKLTITHDDFDKDKLS